MVACAQLAPVFGDVEGNRARATEAITAAAGDGAMLVVLPELCVTGYAFADGFDWIALPGKSGGTCRKGIKAPPTTWARPPPSSPNRAFRNCPSRRSKKKRK